MPGVCQLDSLDILMAGADRPFSLTEKLALALGSRNVGRFWYALIMDNAVLDLYRRFSAHRRIEDATYAQGTERHKIPHSLGCGVFYERLYRKMPRHRCVPGGYRLRKEGTDQPPPL